MKYATCQVDSKSQNLPREYYTRTCRNADHLPFLVHMLKFLGRLIHWVLKLHFYSPRCFCGDQTSGRAPISCCWSLTAFRLTRSRSRPRPFQTLCALDARPASRCPTSSDAAAAGGLFASSAFFTWAAAVRSRASIVVQTCICTGRSRTCSCTSSTCSGWSKSRSLQRSECLAIIARPLFVCGPLRKQRFKHVSVKLLQKILKFHACAPLPYNQSLNACDVVRSRFSSTRSAAAKWRGYASEVSLDNLKRSIGMASSLYISHLAKLNAASSNLQYVGLEPRQNVCNRRAGRPCLQVATFSRILLFELDLKIKESKAGTLLKN